MTPLQSRLTLMVDEWLGIALCVWLWLRAGWPIDVLLVLAITGQVGMVWLAGYLMHWKLEREWKAKKEVPF